MTTPLATNKQVITDYFNEQTAAGLGSALPYLSDDATWWVPGQWELSGTYSKAQLIAGSTSCHTTACSTSTSGK